MSTFLILLGFALLIGMQVAIFAVALAKAPQKAVLCLFIPFFVYVYARREPRARPFLWAWYIGIVLLVAGGVAAG